MKRFATLALALVAVLALTSAAGATNFGRGHGFGNRFGHGFGYGFGHNFGYGFGHNFGYGHVVQTFSYGYTPPVALVPAYGFAAPVCPQAAYQAPACPVQAAPAPAYSAAPCPATAGLYGFGAPVYSAPVYNFGGYGFGGYGFGGYGFGNRFGGYGFGNRFGGYGFGNRFGGYGFGNRFGHNNFGFGNRNVVVVRRQAAFRAPAVRNAGVNIRLPGLNIQVGRGQALNQGVRRGPFGIRR